MKSTYKRTFTGFLLAAVFLIILAVTSQPSQSDNTNLSFYDDKDKIEGELIIMLKEGVDANAFTSQMQDIGLYPKELLYDEYNIWLFGYDVSRSQPENALLSVMGKPDVKIAQFNHRVEERAAPNDSLYANTQWDMNNTGQTGGTVDADIDAPEAWNISTGGLTSQGDTIVVAVVDGGFHLTHPDLNFWKNWADIPGNSIDDDSNGYVDDRNGWNAVNNNGTISSNAHGTHVSGTVGARGNNNIGVAGVSWNVRVMPVTGSSGVEAVVVRAYGYVLKQRKLYNQTNGLKGAYVVATNSSFGVDNGNPANFPLWCAFYDSLGKAGILSAGAGPNAGVNIDNVGDIPTTCPSNYMIAVTNTTNTDARNSGAGFGPIHMDLGAPGTNIRSTNSATGYGNLTGTSMATPHVAGTVGLMFAAANPLYITLADTRPDSVALIFKQFIMRSVDTIPSMSTVLSKGRLNLHKTLQKVSALTSITGNITAADYKLAQNYPNPFNPSTSINFSIPKQGVVKLKIYDMTGKEVAVLLNEIKTAGSYNINFDASALTSGVYFYKLESGDFSETRKMLLVK